MSTNKVTVTVHIDRRASRATRDALRARIREAIDSFDEEGDYRVVLDYSVRTTRGDR